MFGFESPFDGRLGGVLGDELKIGHFYFVFILMLLSSYKLLILKHNKIYLFYFLVFIFNCIINNW